MATLAKPYTVTNASQQSEDIDRMLDELYRAVQDLDEEPASTGVAGLTGSVGPRGADGDEGEDGMMGPIGLTGATGAVGADGATGATGATGTASAVPGADGDDSDAMWPYPTHPASTALTDTNNIARLNGDMQNFTGTAPIFSELLSTNKGIAFPATQVASAGGNVLDDYEEGTWTPTIGGDLTDSGSVFSVQVGRYVKVGKLVLANFVVVFSTLGTHTGSMIVKGFPFTVENVTNSNYSGAILWLTMTASFVYVQCQSLVNAATAQLYGATAAATGLTALVPGDFSNTSNVQGSVIYRATA